jgi:hypothetical protein
MPTDLIIEGLPSQPESFAVQLSSNDQRFTATCRDATGRIFVAWHDANLNVVLCEHRDGRLWYVAGPVPGSKNSCVSLLIAEDGYVRVYYGGRMGADSGPFPLQFEAISVRDVKAWPLPGAGGDDAALAGRVGALEKVYQDLSALVSRIVSALKGIGAALGG